MRNLADGRIRWGFFPPDSDIDRTGKGIWLGGEADVVEEEDDEDADQELTDDEDGRGDESEDSYGSSQAESDVEGRQEHEDEQASEVASSDGDEPGKNAAPGGFFAALDIGDDTDVSEDSEDDGAKE